jgi:L-amino acid N-acyltransferase YncA
MTCRDGSGIAAVAHFGLDRQEEQFIIWAVARATRCAGQNYGTATLEMILGMLRGARRSMGLDCGAFAWVHPQNQPSKHMLHEVGFEHIGDEDGYQGWVHDLAI